MLPKFNDVFFPKAFEKLYEDLIKTFLFFSLEIGFKVTYQ